MTTSENQRHADMRKNPRVNTPDQVTIIDAHSGEMVGQLVNISADGLMLMGANCIAPGTVRQFRFPIGDPEKGAELVVGAEALWCQDANDSGSYWSGFHIIDISAEHQKILLDMVGD